MINKPYLEEFTSVQDRCPSPWTPP